MLNRRDASLLTIQNHKAQNLSPSLSLFRKSQIVTLMFRAKRIVVGSLITLLSLVILLPVALYVPVVQDLVSRGVVAYLNRTGTDLEYQVGKVRIGFPLQLKVEDVTVLKRRNGQTLLHVGRLQTGLDDIPLNQPYFVLNKLGVKDVEVGMDSLTESMSLMGSLKELSVSGIRYDYTSNELRIGQAILSQPDLQLYMGPSVPDSIEEESAPWDVLVDKAIIKDGKLQLDMSGESLADALVGSAPSPYLDYQHLLLTGLNAEAEKITYRPGLIYAEVNTLQGLDERSGLKVNNFQTRFKMQDDLIAINEMDLRLAEADYLSGDFVVDLGQLDTITSIPRLEADLRLAIDSANLLRLAAPYLPSLSDYWVDEQTRMELSGRLTPDSLTLRHFSLSIPHHIDLVAEGNGQSLLNNELRSCNIKAHGSMTQADFLLSTFVDAPDQREYRLPDSLQFTIDATQRRNDVLATLTLQQKGAEVLNVDARYNFANEAYSVAARTENLCVSDYMPSMMADGMTARVEAKGRHFRFPGKYTRLDAVFELDSIRYLAPDGTKDRLQNITANASLQDGMYSADIQSQHPSLMLDTHLEGWYTRDTLLFRGYIDVPFANLAHLPYGLSQPELGTAGMRSLVYGAYNWKDNAQVDFRLDSLAYRDATMESLFDDIIIEIDSYPGILTATLSGGDANIMAKMDRGISELPVVLDSLLGEWNRQKEQLSFDFDQLQSYLPAISLDLHMARENPFYQAIEYRTGYTFRTADLKLRNDEELQIEGQVISLYGNDGAVDFDTLSLHLHPCESLVPLHHDYAYNAHATHIDPRARKTYDIHCDGRIMPDSLTAGLTYINGNYLTLYDLAASVAVRGDTLTLHLEKDPTIYELPFRINSGNYFSVMNFLTSEDRALNTRARMLMEGPRDLKLNLYSRPSPDSPLGNQLLLLVRNLDLAYATDVMEWEGDAGGKANLSVAFNIFPDSLSARLSSGIKDFHLGTFTTDTLSFRGNYAMVGEDKNLDGVLKVDSIVKLSLTASLTDSVNVWAHIDELPLPLVNTFLPNDMQLYGYTTGDLSLRGRDMEHAKVNATATMAEAGLVFTDMDAILRFPTEPISIRNNKLSLRDYKIMAANGNPVTMTGEIDMSKELGNPSIKLNISGKQVDLINNNRLRHPDQYITGRLPISPNIRVRGNLSNLDVSGTLNVLSGTRLNYYMSDDPLEASSRVDQLVDFVSFRQIDRRIQSGELRRAPLQDQTEEGLKIGLKIEIAKDVKVAAHLAGTDHNRVDIEGGGSLNLSTNSDGDLIMNGTYDVTSGKVNYKLPVLPMVKTFDISNSSKVFWEGSEPGNPEIDIRAVEEVKATVNDDNGSRVVRFDVGINISGTLDALKMTFDCDSPEDGAISSDIASLDDDERSRTALLLLIAQTYIGPGNTSSVGLGTANAALNSMLNRQLDSMLGNMKGTKIDVGIDTYSTDAGSMRTDYSVKVSQNLFNDRFRATIGGQVSSGNEIGQSSGAQLGDMSLEWLIRKDGSHYMKVFRHTNYESVLEGQLIETGVSYVQERSGFKFRNLLLPTNQKRKKRIEEMIRKMQQKEELEEMEQNPENETDTEEQMAPANTSDSHEQ